MGAAHQDYQKTNAAHQDGDRAELRKAGHLWGRTTWETDRMIKEELKDREIQVASIGPAGENLVRFPAIISSLNRANGRCGMGAVMGSKKLKAVAVRGNKDIHDFIDESKTEGKAPVVIWCENSSALADGMGLCEFVDKMWFTRAKHHSVLPEELADLITTATGWDVTGEELTRIGERIVNLERALLVRDGLSRKGETLPGKYQFPLPDGPSRGLCITPEELDQMLDDYYDRRGWDRDGRPTRKTLLGLGMKDVADAPSRKGGEV